MAGNLPKAGSIVARLHIGGDQDGIETEHLVQAARMDPTEGVWSILVVISGDPGWVLWQPEEGQWRLAP